MFLLNAQLSTKFISNSIFLLKLFGVIVIFVGCIIAIQLNRKYNTRFSLLIALCLFIGYRVFFLMLNSNAKIEYILICILFQSVLFIGLILYAKYKKKNKEKK